MERDHEIHNNIDDWLIKHKDEFKPPICNKIMFNNQLVAFFIVGPNQRKDFHIENGEEIFYMIRGDMNLKILNNGEYRDMIIKEGEIFVLPPKVYHSPRRSANSLGFVVERKRDMKDDIDGLLYFDEPTTRLTHEVYMHVEDLQYQLRDVALKAQKDIGEGNFSISENAPIKPQKDLQLINPICLEHFIKQHEKFIQSEGCINLYPNNYKSKIQIFSNGEFNFDESSLDTIFWTFAGNASIIVESKTFELKTSDFYVVKAGLSSLLLVPSNHLVLKININR